MGLAVHKDRLAKVNKLWQSLVKQAFVNNKKGDIMYYFLRKDFEALSEEIAKIADRIKEIGKEMGKSCQEGAETF